MDSLSGNINFEDMQKKLQDHLHQTQNWQRAQQFHLEQQQRLEVMDTTSQDTISHETIFPCEDNLQPLDFSTKKERSPSPPEYSQRRKSSSKVSSRNSIESSSPSSSSIISPDSCSITPSSPSNYHHRLGSEMSCITQLPQFSHMSQLQRPENFLMTGPHKKESPSKDESPIKNSLSITPIPNLAPVDMGLHLQSNSNVAQIQALAAQNPLFVSAMCSMLGQKVAAEAQAATQHNNLPPSPSPISQFPFLGPQLGYQGAGPQLGFPGTIPAFNAIGVPPLIPPLNHDDNAYGNENFIKFRTEMYAKGQIGGQPKSRRKQARSSQKEMRHQAADSGNDYRSDESSDKDEEGRSKSGSKDTTVKDEAYWEKRKKNNEAAKRSRDARRLKEEDTAVKAAFYERENIQLRLQLMAYKYELNNCEAALRANRASEKNCMV